MTQDEVARLMGELGQDPRMVAIDGWSVGGRHVQIDAAEEWTWPAIEAVSERFRPFMGAWGICPHGSASIVVDVVEVE